MNYSQKTHFVYNKIRHKTELLKKCKKKLVIMTNHFILQQVFFFDLHLLIH